MSIYQDGGCMCKVSEGELLVQLLGHFSPFLLWLYALCYSHYLGFFAHILSFTAFYAADCFYSGSDPSNCLQIRIFYISSFKTNEKLCRKHLQNCSLYSVYICVYLCVHSVHLHTVNMGPNFLLTWKCWNSPMLYRACVLKIAFGKPLIFAQSRKRN